MAKSMRGAKMLAVAVCVLISLPALGAELRSRRSILQDKSKDVKCLKDITACKLINGTNVCANTTSDRSHCGACNNACRVDQTCTARVCTATPASPIPSPRASPSPSPSPKASPSPSPSPTLTPSACSAVGTVTCASGGPACCAGLTCCSGVCTNTSTSTIHCGACSKPCLSTQTCTAGGCVALVSQITNINLGPYNTCTAAGAAVTRVPRCVVNGTTQVPGVVVNVTTTMINSLNIKPWSGTIASPGCLRASLCGMTLPAGTQLDLAWLRPAGWSLPSPTGPWVTCTSNNCPNTTGTSNIIFPWSGANPAGETLHIQSSNGNCVSGIILILRWSPDCLYNTTFVGPLNNGNGKGNGNGNGNGRNLR